MQIDLHGYHVHEGWRKFKRAADEAYFANHRKAMVITGQGVMMHEFPTWAQNHPYVAECRQNKYNPGSFSIKFKKKG